MVLDRSILRERIQEAEADPADQWAVILSDEKVNIREALSHYLGLYLEQNELDSICLVAKTGKKGLCQVGLPRNEWTNLGSVSAKYDVKSRIFVTGFHMPS